MATPGVEDAVAVGKAEGIGVKVKVGVAVKLSVPALVGV